MRKKKQFKIQILTVGELRAKVMGKTQAAAVYRAAARGPAGALGRPRLRRLLDGVGRRRRRRDGAGAGDALERRPPADGRRARRERGGGVDEKRERSRAG